MTLINFGCLVKWCADILSEILIQDLAFDSCSKIAQFQLGQILIIHEQNILRLEISVHDFLTVQVLNTRQNLFEYQCRIQRQKISPLSYLIVELTTFAKSKDINKE